MSQRASALAAGIALFVSLACGSSEEKRDRTPARESAEGVKPAADSSRTGDVHPGASRAAKAPRPEPAFDRTQIDLFMKAWLDAQNNGKFDDYKKLYASDFTGVLTIGKRSKDLDRAGWFKSRGRMFKRKMRVDMGNPRITTTPKQVEITFIQTFQSGRFKDEGPKRILIVKEDGELRIKREVMLESNILKSMRRAKEGFTRIDELPRSLVKDLRKLEKSPWELSSIHKLSLGKVKGEAIVAFLSEDPEQMEEDDYGQIEVRGQLVLAVKNDDGYRALSAAAARSGHGIELEYFDERDFDGDAVNDLIVVYGGSAFHEHYNGVFLVSSKDQAVYEVEYGSGGGEEGYHSERTPTYACITRIDGALTFVAALAMTVSEFDFESGESDETVQHGLRVFAVGKEGLELVEKVYGYSLASAGRPGRLVEKWREHVGDKSAEPKALYEYQQSGSLIDLPTCFGGDNPAFIFPGESVKGAKGEFQLIAGLSRTAEAAKEKAAKHAPQAKLVELQSMQY